MSNTRDRQRLELKGIVDFGSPGEDNDAENPLSRALHTVMIDGKPARRVHASYLQLSPIDDVPRWFGAFVLSEGNRIIFFPGIEGREGVAIQSEHGETTQNITVDHLTLEADRKSWHLTTKKSQHHLFKRKTRDLGSDRRLWFGMSARTTSFRPLKETTLTIADVPTADSERRMNLLDSALRDVENNIIGIDATTEPDVDFVHFSVIVGPCGFPPYVGTELGLPHGSPFVATRIAGSYRLRSHRVKLPPHLDLEIITSVHYGSVRGGASFTSAW